MPLYDFENTRTGEVREFMTPAGVSHMRRRDGRWKRREVSRLGIVVGAKPEPAQAEEVISGYHKVSEKLGTRFRSRYSAQQIKDAWAKPDLVTA